MKAVFLGTGTSAGVPVIGCACAVCRSSDPKNRRRRTSLYLSAGGTHLVVDTPPDFRDQALEYGIERVDAVLFTHAHADHIFGFDDIRRFNTMQGEVIPAFAPPATVEHLRRVFDYISTEEEPGVYRPLIEFVGVEGPFEVGAFRVEPLPVRHDPRGRPTVGYLVSEEGRSIGYVPDCVEMSDAVIERLRGVDVMVLDALRVHPPHMSHFTVDESLEVLRRIGAGKSFLIHMCHDLDHEETNRLLPDGISLSYDGMTLDW
ncbi:MAG: MBL fold metallo-hydrolase [Lentisphaerae bacterium]|nr:MBL fold metallo-hydrolase [Lentisphaerota bacterium]